MRLALLLLLGLNLGCAAHKAVKVRPFSFMNEPDVIRYRMPDNCVWAYNVEAPHTRESVMVVYCNGKPTYNY